MHPCVVQRLHSLAVRIARVRLLHVHVVHHIAIALHSRRIRVLVVHVVIHGLLLLRRVCVLLNMGIHISPTPHPHASLLRISAIHVGLVRRVVGIPLHITPLSRTHSERHHRHAGLLSVHHPRRLLRGLVHLRRSRHARRGGVHHGSRVVAVGRGCVLSCRGHLLVRGVGRHAGSYASSCTFSGTGSVVVIIDVWRITVHAGVEGVLERECLVTRVRRRNRSRASRSRPLQLTPPPLLYPRSSAAQRAHSQCSQQSRGSQASQASQASQGSSHSRAQAPRRSWSRRRCRR